MNEMITLCGDNCLFCPRYNARTEAERKVVAELWHRIGWRTTVVSGDEIACNGCNAEKACTYQLVECTQAHHVPRCNQCTSFPCEKIREMLMRSAEYQRKCARVCTEKEYHALELAFFRKEQNLLK